MAMNYASTNVDPADDGVEITGAAQTISPTGRAIHCDTSGTMTFTLARGVTMTRTFKGGGIYPYAVASIASVGGGFTGAIMR